MSRLQREEKKPTDRQLSPQKRKKNLYKRVLVLLLLSAVLLLALLAVRSFPLRLKLSLSGSTTTSKGTISRLQLEVEANQPLRTIYYALNPTNKDDPAQYQIFARSRDFLNGRQRYAVPDLPLKIGQNELCFYVTTAFGRSPVESFTLHFDFGHIAEPDDSKKVDLGDGLKLIANELLIYVKEGYTRGDLEKTLKNYGGEVVGFLGMLDLYQARFSTSEQSELEDLIRKLEQEACVESCHFNQEDEVGLDYIPSDPNFDSWDEKNPKGNNWGLELIQAPQAWEYLSELSPVKVGVVDSFIDQEHEDLLIQPQNAMINASPDFSTMAELGTYMNEHKLGLYFDGKHAGTLNHGTHVMGIIAAAMDNGRGIAGVNGRVKPYFTTFLRYIKKADGGLDAYSSLFSDIFAWSQMIYSGCRVINLSYGSSYSSEALASEAQLYQLFESCVEKWEKLNYDFLFVRAAGNSRMDAEKFFSNRIHTRSEALRRHSVIVGSVKNLGKALFGADEDAPKRIYYRFAPYSNFGDSVDIAAPGSEIYSTAFYNPDSPKERKYMMMSGTSMAAPMVSGVASLIYGIQPQFDYKLVKQILLNSDTFAIHNYQVYSLLNAKWAVELARKVRDNREIPQLPRLEKIGYVTGMITDAKSGAPIGDVSIEVIDENTGETILCESEAQEEGYYGYPLKAGLYTMHFAKDDYVTETIGHVSIDEGIFYQNVELKLAPQETGTGKAQGNVLDAVTGAFVPNAEISIRKGINNTSGAVIASMSTGNEGHYSFELPPGNYTIEAAAENYRTGRSYAVITSGVLLDSQNVILTPKMKEGEIRVILRWGRYPEDLDSHMTGPMPNTDRFHVFYQNMGAYSDSNLYTNLDVDDTSSYGPETISVYLPVAGTYTYSVHDYSNRMSSDSVALANSEAQVLVYTYASDEARIFNVPMQAGTVWEVFSVENGIVSPINKMYYQNDPWSVGP